MRFMVVAAAVVILGAGSASALSCSKGGVTITESKERTARTVACDFSGNDTGKKRTALEELKTLFPDGTWTLGGKSDGGSGFYRVSAENGKTSGSWSLDEAVTGLFAITLKASTGFSLYVFDIDFDAKAGTFDTALADLKAGNDKTNNDNKKNNGKNNKNKNNKSKQSKENAAELSHLSLFTFKPKETPTTTTAVPLPAGLWLLLAAITGVGVLRRRLDCRAA